MQDIIQAVGNGKSPFSGGGFNIVKWMLGVMSIFFDIIFMIQHYVLYRHSNTYQADHESQQLMKNVYYYTKLEWLYNLIFIEQRD